MTATRPCGCADSVLCPQHVQQLAAAERRAYRRRALLLAATRPTTDPGVTPGASNGEEGA